MGTYDNAFGYPRHDPLWDQPDICEVCGKDVDDCRCPECFICGDIGNPRCYREHGLKGRQMKTHEKCYLEFEGSVHDGLNGHETCQLTVPPPSEGHDYLTRPIKIDDMFIMPMRV